MKTYRDTMTAQDKADLADFLASLDAERDFLRENPYTPLFGQYTPNLIFTDEEDPTGTPDPHYYATNGDNPPQEAQEPLEPPYPVLGALCAFVLFGGAVVTIWVSLAYALPWVVGCYLNMMCK